MSFKSCTGSTAAPSCRHLGYALLFGYVVARGGFFNRVTWIVPERKIQTVHLEETPFQRRRGLATVVVDTAAGAVPIVDLMRDEALSMLARMLGPDRVSHSAATPARFSNHRA